MVNATPQPSNFEPMFAGTALVQGLVEMIREQSRQIAALREEMVRRNNVAQQPDGWMDAGAAAKYLSMSATTFDKHRYSSSPKIPGSRVGGKVLYKRSDLDNWVRLHEIKSSGLA